MACSHNQAVIDSCQAQISANNANIASMEAASNDAKAIKGQHEAFKGQIDCAVSNFANNILGGTAICSPNCSEMSAYAQNTINEADAMMKAFESKIGELNEQNSQLQATIAAHQGDCGPCATAKQQQWYK